MRNPLILTVVAAATMLAAGCVNKTSVGQRDEIHTISVQQANADLNKRPEQFIDVRTPAEFSACAHTEEECGYPPYECWQPASHF